MCVVSESSKMYTQHLRSFGAIVKERQRQILNYGFRIHPFSKANLIWSLTQLVVIFIEVVTLALSYVFFSMNSSFVYLYIFSILRYAMNAFFGLVVILNFFTGYYDEPNQEVVLDSTKIASEYFKTFFILDLTVTIPLEASYYLFWFWDKKTVQLLNCVKFLVVIRFYKHFKFCAEVLSINYYKYMVALVVICALFYWHIVCCLLMLFRLHLSSGGRKELMFKYARTIMHSFWSDISKTHPEIRAIIGAYYRGSLIIYNSSYGTDLPSTEAEVLLIWFGWYASSLFFIYILALIMEIMKGKTSAAHKYVEMEKQLKDYMRHKQLPMIMRSRILTYYEFRFQKSYFRENEILDTISEQLRQEINMHACRKLVENVIFFRNLPLNLLVRIISCLRIEVYLVNDIIIKANTPGTSMYFISTGTVAIYTKSGKEICHLEDGSHFGEIALIIKDTLRTASVIAVEVSEIYRLDQKDFVKAINPYPDLLANIQHIAAERMEVASMLDEYNRKEQTTKR
ncbi:potassium/sodium hyperpolarization-activated cyclic nucleotide-gated channel 2-like [Sitophilus oryzae]|uniref:Potassium/sodium hyperpolarization-activated cyclic nucleotide-gated channel 2-like n=1 Tax=Sitophilus oryzae TaxID=7048 RepID=A0A6J2X1T8_SITOR|nr:potassium/sodium hyperpolarization-activated cyclic nucleotide-gated channel 2-like [Sitophilus oryzae]XP_030744961.1 potassium/sodium hyperpolarization-activated cyclic nucleotide-gated channel 2-like [Sitophilus oryzae]